MTSPKNPIPAEVLDRINHCVNKNSLTPEEKIHDIHIILAAVNGQPTSPATDFNDELKKWEAYAFDTARSDFDNSEELRRCLNALRLFVPPDKCAGYRGKMTKEEHLQQQCNLLYNVILSMTEGLRFTGTPEQRKMLHDLSATTEKAFADLDARYLASSVPDEKGE